MIRVLKCLWVTIHQTLLFCGGIQVQRNKEDQETHLCLKNSKDYMIK